MDRLSVTLLLNKVDTGCWWWIFKVLETCGLIHRLFLFTLNFTLHFTLHYTLHYTSHFTLHHTSHFTLHYTILYYTTLYTKLHYTTLYTTLHFTLHYTLHYTTLHLTLYTTLYTTLHLTLYITLHLTLYLKWRLYNFLRFTQIMDWDMEMVTWVLVEWLCSFRLTIVMKYVVLWVCHLLIWLKVNPTISLLLSTPSLWFSYLINTTIILNSVSNNI